MIVNKSNITKVSTELLDFDADIESVFTENLTSIFSINYQEGDRYVNEWTHLMSYMGTALIADLADETSAFSVAVLGSTLNVEDVRTALIEDLEDDTSAFSVAVLELVTTPEISEELKYA